MEKWSGLWQACDSDMRTMRTTSLGFVMPVLVLAILAGGAPPDPPEGAVKIADDLYAVPLAETDDDGCRPWRLWSAERMVVQSLHYRRKDGGFTQVKAEAACMQGCGPDS